jgi:hypothetical protein
MRTRSTALALIWLAAMNLAAATDLTPGGNTILAPEAFHGGYTFELGAFQLGEESAESRQALLRTIASWLSSEIGLPLIDELPAIAFASPRQIEALRHLHLSPGDAGNAHLHAPVDDPEIIAIYRDDVRTIYLPEGWSGRTPQELSILVHEMVHHVQNVAELRFACPEHREKSAFEAQALFLALFDTDLEAEFGIDPFTLLVRTNCLF